MANWPGWNAGSGPPSPTSSRVTVSPSPPGDRPPGTGRAWSRLAPQGEQAQPGRLEALGDDRREAVQHRVPELGICFAAQADRCGVEAHGGDRLDGVRAEVPPVRW